MLPVFAIDALPASHILLGSRSLILCLVSCMRAYGTRNAIAALLALLPLLICGETPLPAVPPDFKVRAKFGSGSIAAEDGDVIAWNASINDSGKGYVDAISYTKGVRHVRRKTKILSAAALEELVKVIDTSRFFALPHEMLGQMEDSPTYILEVTARGKTQRVCVYAPFDVHDKRTLHRFRLVWSAVFDYLPSPDGGGAVHHLEVNS